MLRIYRPVSTNWFSQGFGENKICAKINTDGEAVRPFVLTGKTDGKVCPVGYAEFYPLLGLFGHPGEDWATFHGERLYFNVDFPEAGGWHSKDAHDSDGGLGVDVISNNPVTLNGRTMHIKFRFWHLMNVAKQQDDIVEMGEFLGQCDSTGASSGDHVHWCIKWCYPDGAGFNEGDGRQGAFDFRPWFTNVFVLNQIKYDQELGGILTPVQGLHLSPMEYAKFLILFCKKLAEQFLK